MEWRCAWCGKPHEENDPPCENCQHGEFEKAVVPAAPEGDDDSETTTVWVCTDCGNDHPKNTPPCDRCGGGPLERREVTYDQEAVMAEMLGEDDTEGRPSADIGYLDVLDTKTILLFLGVGALVTIIALGYLGFVTVPFLPNTGPVPGDATSVDGRSLAAVEDEYVTELNARRSAGGAANLTRNADLASTAEWTNQQLVRQDHGNGNGIDGGELRSRIDEACGDAELTSVVFNTTVSTDDSEAALARSLVDVASRDRRFDDPVANGIVGVDVHAAPNGELYVTQFAC